MTSADKNCRLNHDDPDGLPQFLCRACHPELTLPRVKHDPAADAAVRQQDSARVGILRALEAARLKLSEWESLYGNAARTAIEKQRAKIARLEKKLAGVSDGKHAELPTT